MRILFVEVNAINIRSVKHSIETGRPRDVKARSRGAHGVYRWFHVRSRPQLDAEGLVRWYTLATDMTKRAEAELEKAFEEIKRLKDRLHDENVAEKGFRCGKLLCEVKMCLQAIDNTRDIGGGGGNRNRVRNRLEQRDSMLSRFHRFRVVRSEPTRCAQH
jgi:hypothetical protein